VRSLPAFLLLALASRAAAQNAPTRDTLPRRLDPVVVTAERTPAGLVSSVAAVTRITAAELARLPRATLADVLRLAPGFALVDFDGLGFDPQVMVRGFYGGGEAEYVIVQIDGRPVNQVQSGVVAWDVLPPLVTVEAVEIVRGGAASLYGDAAIGGVINIISRAPEGSVSPWRLRGEAAGGAFGTWRGGAGVIGPGGVSLSGGVDRTGGFRDHAARTSVRVSGSAALLDRAAGRLSVSLRSHWREFEEPGALLEGLHQQNRRGSDPLFRFDRTTDRDHAMVLDAEHRFQGGARLSATAGVELRDIDAIRTLALAPGFGDTKERDASTTRVAFGVQLEAGDTPLPGNDRVTLGIEGSRGSLNATYYNWMGGDRSEYVGASAERGDLDTRSQSRRAAGALYAQYVVQASSAVRLSLGGRFDVLDDRFNPSVPSGQSHRTATHSVLSPKLGINFRYLNRRAGSGHAWVAVSRSFKAPTLDQKYDLRNIPIPFPPFVVHTSNPDLEPQYGTSVEAGIYHGGDISPSLRASATLAAYRMEMRDELDFDVTSFRYVNIGKSRHQGIEAGGSLDGGRASAFAFYTLQAPTSRTGDNAGKRLKAIPRHTVTSGLSILPIQRRPRVQTSLALTHVRGIYLDDANTRTLPGYTRVDAQVSVGSGRLEIHFDIRNLLNKKYSTSGFLDPAGSGEAYLYPAAERVFTVGLRWSW